MRFFAFTALALVGFAGSAHAAEYELDSAHSRVGFSVRHMMVSNVRGEFQKFKGTVMVDDKDLSKSKVDITIDPSSINTNQEKRDGHLKSPDFFDVTKFPAITFVSTKVETGKGDALKVTGNLNMHGVTKSVTLDATYTTPRKDIMGMMRGGFTATTTVNRKDFGLVWNKSMDGGGVVVADDVKLDLEGELVQTPAKK